MKSFAFLFLLTCSTIAGTLPAADTTPVQAVSEELLLPEDESTLINRLIQASEDHIQQLKKLQALINTYKKTEEECIQHSNDADKLYKLAQSGKDVYDAIDSMHMNDYFKAEFMADIKKLKDIADKKVIPQVK